MQRLNYLVVQDTVLVSLKSICKGHSHWLSKYSSWSLMGLYGDLKQTKVDQVRPWQTKAEPGTPRYSREQPVTARYRYKMKC